MKKNLIVLTLLMAVSCGTSEKKEANTNTVFLTEKTLPKVEALNLEKINVSEDYLIGASCFVYQDSVLLVLKSSDPKPLTHMLTLVNLNTGNVIGEYFTRGQGPDEILSSIGYFGGGYLDIRCFVSNKYISFNIDSAITAPNNYKPNIISIKENIICDSRTINDTTILATNMFYFGVDGEFQTANIPEFFTINKYGKLNPEYKSSDYEKIKFLPANVTGCEISINTKKDRIICCYHYQPCIKVFDLNMNQIRQINGPEPDDGNYKLEDDNFTLFFDGGVNHYYFQSYSDDDNIIVINNRTHKWVKEFKGDIYTQKEKQTTEIFRLDWEGNMIARYSAKGNELMRASYSRTTNTLYIWMIGKDGEHAMYKAKLN